MMVSTLAITAEGVVSVLSFFAGSDCVELAGRLSCLAAFSCSSSESSTSSTKFTLKIYLAFATGGWVIFLGENPVGVGLAFFLMKLSRHPTRYK